MNLKELKKMISEEYQYWLKEQPVGAPEMPGAEMPGAGMPGVEVGPNDIDVTGGEDSEATLRQIYDMLKDYFEGGGAPAAPAAPAGDMDMDMDMDMDDEEEDVSEEKDEEKDDKKDKKESKKDKEDLKERFKKLANIVKG